MPRLTTVYMPNEDNTQISPLQPGEARDYSKAMGSFSGGGGLVSTAADYLRFVQMLPEPPLPYRDLFRPVVYQAVID